MTVVLFTSASTSPWSRPTDWQDPGHTVELVGAGGNGLAGTTGASGRGQAGGGGGAYLGLSSPSGALGSTTAFAVKVGASTTNADTNATFWEGTTTTNTYQAHSGVVGVTATGGAGGTGVTNGTPSPVTYTTTARSGGSGGSTSAVIGGGGGGGGAGGPDLTAGQTGSNGAAGGTSTGSGGGGGGAGDSIATPGVVGASVNGSNGANGGSGSGGGTGHSGGGTNANQTGGAGSVGGGGGGGGGSTVNTSGAIGTGGAGGTLGNTVDWTDNSGGPNDGVTGGVGGGGGGGGGFSAAVAATSGGGAGANYGGGGGGGGGLRTAGTAPAGTAGSGLLVITYNAVTLGMVPSTNAFVITYAVRRSPVATYNLYYWRHSNDLPVVAAQPETQPHFIGRFRPAIFSRWPELYHRQQEPITLEAQPHFIGKFKAAIFTPFLGLYRAAALDQPVSVDDPQHFVPRFRAPQHYVLTLLRSNVASDTSAPQVETQPHFLTVPWPVAHSVYMPLFASPDAAPTAAVDYPQHFVPRFCAPQHDVLTSLRSNVAADTSAPQPEAQPHFIAKFMAAIFTPFLGLYRAAALDQPPAVQPASPHFIALPWPTAHSIYMPLFASPDAASTATVETPQHFIPRFTAPQHYVLRLLRSNVAADTSAPQTETQPHFIGRFTAATFVRWSELYHCQSGLASIPEAQPHFIATPWKISLNVLPSLRQASDNQIQVQPETNQHFIGRYIAPALSRWSGLYGAAAVEQVVVAPPLETNQHFVGRFTASVFTPFLGLYRSGAVDQPVVVAQPPANPHFIATPWQVTSTLFMPSRQNSADITVQTTFETNTHFIPTFYKSNYSILPLLRSNIAADDSSVTPPPTVVPGPATNAFVIAYHVKRSPIASSYLYNFTNASSESGPPPSVQPETNIHFIPRFFAASHTIVPLLRSNIAADTSVAPTQQPETNQHFVGRFKTAIFTPFLGLYRTAAFDQSVVVQPSTNPHFIAQPWPVVSTLFMPSRQNSADIPLGVADAPVHFLGRFTKPSISRWSGLYTARAVETGPLPQAETQPHFIAKFKAPQHYILTSLRQAPDNQTQLLPIQPETQPHFLGRFTSPSFARFNYNVRSDETSPTAETQPHFISKPWLPAFKLLSSLRQNAAVDVPSVVAETNTHFIGKFTSPPLSRFSYNVQSDGTATPVQETNTHFVGKFSQPRHIVLPGLRQTIAADISVQPETNTHTIGRFIQPKHVVPLGLRISSAAYDTSIAPRPEPETNTNVLGTFKPPIFSLLSSLRQNPAVDFAIGPPPVPIIPPAGGGKRRRHHRRLASWGDLSNQEIALILGAIQEM